ncbi:hypothetical protein SDC9_178849 [bioreactor metagenome]|uniref:Uncharacterized protein n=1 Tax=bioreactor metagenome TaxID=1076179 RepID=A0A645GX37_9ZZZZ
MKCQRKLKSEEQKAYPISANYLIAYEQAHNHLFHEIFFRYSGTDTYPVIHEFDLSVSFMKYTVSAHLDLLGEADITMKTSDAYLRCTGKCTISSEVSSEV